MELATHIAFGTWNVDVAPSFLENLCTPGVIDSYIILFS